jgi:outer membrane lipoprotein-sorting protein
MFKPSMHSLVFFAWMAAAVPAFGQAQKPSGDERAKHLFQKMEDRLASVKTLDSSLVIIAQISEGTQTKQFDLVGSLTVADGDRVHIELKKKTADADDLPGVPFQRMISDGKRMLVQDSGMPKPMIHDKLPENFKTEILTELARSGFFLPTLPLPPVEATDNKDRFPVSEFKLGPKEKIGDRETQRLDYRFDVKGQKEPSGEDAPLRASVWIDLKTTLPLKRVITWKFMGAQAMAVTENYEKLVTDEKPDTAKFEIPE